jgi:L-seryl-tRNA(Ser) seleniumtransferase
MVVVSGGKAIGAAVGRRSGWGARSDSRSAEERIANSTPIGRSCKVHKEEMVGMMVALESFMKDDYAAIYKGWERTAEQMRTALTKLPGVQAEIFTPEIANQCPHVRTRWEASKYAMTAADVMQKLRDGEPSIELVPAPTVANTLEVASWMLQAGEAEIITRRVREILTGGA